MSEKVDIKIWSDVMCPWCVIGYHNLATALENLDGEIEAEIGWLPFELNPDMPSTGEESAAHIARKYGRTAEQTEAARGAMAQAAEKAGFSFSYTGEGEAPAPMMWNTFAAHRLLTWVGEEHGAKAQTRLKLALFRAHFQQRRRVGDETVLLAIAEEQGFDRDAAQAALADERLAEKVRAEERAAWDHNISGVPAMVIDGKFLIPGSQDPETYANALRRIVSKRAAA